MRQAQTFDFNFKNVEKQFESYHGINVKLRFVPSITYPGTIQLRSLDAFTFSDTLCGYSYLGECRTLSRRKISGCIPSVCLLTATIRLRWKLASKIVYISNLSITSPSAFIHPQHAQALLILLQRYHLKDVIVGKIYFLLVRIKIKHMELSIIRRETTGSPPNQYNESETITKFEIMDGAPVRGKWES